MKKVNLICLLLITLLAACGSEEESARSKTIAMLTGNTEKRWSVYEYFLDDQQTGLSPCDSSYVLTMKSDFTWSEDYSRVFCQQSTAGQWSLNEQNDVIIITYLDFSTGQPAERKFEIMELTTEIFSYQFAARNVLKRIRMQVSD